MLIKTEIYYLLKAIKYAIVNPRDTLSEFFINPIKLIRNWHSKSFQNRKIEEFKLNNVPAILDRMGDVASKVAYLKELCFRTLYSHSLAYASGLADKLNITMSDQEIEKRKTESEKINLPYKFMNNEADKRILASAQIYPQYIYPEYIDGEINKEEVILDCGSYIGDTALWFEKHLGENGKVYSFEPHPQIREVLNENIQRFSQGKIKVFPYAVSDGSGTAYFSEIISVSATLQKKSRMAVQTISLDEFCLKEKTPIIPTLIKMDVEGAELSALIGAKEIITKYKPKLAICTYHETPHLWEIPEKIMEYSDDYVFYFKKHSTVCESVIYAFPKK